MSRHHSRIFIEPKPRYFDDAFWRVQHTCAFCREPFARLLKETVRIAYRETGKQMLCCASCYDKFKQTLPKDRMWDKPLPFEPDKTYTPIGGRTPMVLLSPPKGDRF